jgi:hypothetical protein
MEYPGAHFTRLYRHLLLGLFIAAFLVVTPAVLISTAGYRYDWRAGLLKETGSLSIDGEPEELTVYLNNLKLKGGLPVRLKSLTPRSYSVRLSAPGYYDWQKEVNIKSRQTVYLKDIRLIKKAAPVRLVGGMITTLSLSPSGRYLLYTSVRPGRADTRLRDLKRGRDLALPELPPTPNVVRWAKKNSWLAVGSGPLPAPQIFLIDPARAALVAITAPSREPIEDFQWTDQAEPELYYQTPSALWSYLPASRKSVLVTAKTFDRWYLDGAVLWTLEFSTSTGRLRVVKDALGFAQDFPLTPSDYPAAEPLASASNTPDWFAAHGDTAIVKLAKSGRIKIIGPEKTFTVTADHWLQSAATGWWFLWHPHEVTVYAAGHEPELLQRSGDSLQDIILLDDYNTVALQGAKDTTVLFPYYLVSHPFLTGSFTALAADTANRTLYAAGTIKDQAGLWQLDY